MVQLARAPINNKLPRPIADEIAVLLINNFDPDTHWIDEKKIIRTLEGDIPQNEGTEELVQRQLQIASSINERDLIVFTRVASLMLSCIEDCT